MDLRDVKSGRRSRVPVLLVALSVIPLVGGVVRVLKLSGQITSTPDDLRFVQAPAPVVIHIICATIYCLVGAFQFDDHLRRTRPHWHRRAGWVAAGAGFLAAMSGLWMTLSYSIPRLLQGELLWGVRLLVGSTMGTAVILAIRAITRGDVRSHRAWMVRAYALGQGAGTQALLLLPPALVLGHDVTGFPRDVFLVMAWLLNAVVAEVVILRQSGRVTRRRVVSAEPTHP